MIFVLRVAVAVSLVVPIAVAAQSPSRMADTKAVEAVLSEYKAAIEKLDATGTERLFATDSQIFETGGSEGTYATYLAHHLGPELAAFKSFKFSDYKVTVRFEGPVALATESYRFRIEPKTGAVAERLGVATSVLRRVGGNWKIVSMHNSGRKPKGA
ncbi:YybH family protein [Sphingomonas sp. PL20]|uniref:YybH family protein n=1 Tax=Sphingomonas sp. PL20 TaxID=2760712 RepID=UPI001AEB1ECA